MIEYNDWKMIDWIIAGIVAISFLEIPDWFLRNKPYTISTVATVYDYPDNIPIIIAGVFLIYYFLSGVYWIINKKINRVVHHCLVATLYISMVVLYIIAYNSGM